MNKDIVKGHWHEIKGRLKAKWGELTDDEIDEMEGSREELDGILQKRYGYAKDRTKKEIDDFLRENSWNDE